MQIASFHTSDANTSSPQDGRFPKVRMGPGGVPIRNSWGEGKGEGGRGKREEEEGKKRGKEKKEGEERKEKEEEEGEKEKKVRSSQT